MPKVSKKRDEAVAQLAKFCVTITDEMIPAPIPANDEERLTTLASLGILNDLPMEGLDLYEILLERRSAYLMTGESRTSYEHYIPPVSRLRYSVTLRTLR